MRAIAPGGAVPAQIRSLLVFLLILAAAVPLYAQTSVLSYQYDISRAGVNAAETALTPANVNASQFGKLFSYAVDGYVYAQPLYVPNVSIAGRGSHNVVFVVTEHDSLYAFDADGPGDPRGGLLWQVSFLNPSAGVTSVPDADTGCNQIVPEIGITGTPVIDPQSGTLYLVAMTKEISGGQAAYFHRLHAIDITSGAERFGSPVVVQASTPGTGDGGTVDVFQPKNYKQRPGLLLLNGVVYTAFSSHCDFGQYHGWLMGYDAQSLQQVTVYNSTPNGNEGSFWAGGAAPAADSSGNIYIVSANGTADYSAGGGDLGESYIKLSTSGGLSVADYFTPFNRQLLNVQDLDVGSAGVAFLGDEAGSPAHPHLMAGAGKEGRIYLLDRDALGGFQSGSDSQIVQSLPGALAGSLAGNPAYFNSAIYFCGAGDRLKAYSVSNAQMSPAPTSQSAAKVGGCVPTVSANGTSNGIVWALAPSAILHAYDAADLASELYNSAQNNGRDALGSYVKFSVPSVANGKVYAGTQNSLAVYGLLQPGASTVAAANAASGDPQAIAPGALVSLYGAGLSQTIGSSYPLPAAALGAASVTMNGWPAPLLYASPQQLNIQVPFELVPGQAAIQVLVNGAPAASGNTTVQPAAPGLFQLGQNRAAALNADGSLNGPGNPAAPGSVIYLYATGLGAGNPPVATGAPAGSNPPVPAAAAVTAVIGGLPATVQIAWIDPGNAGLYQVLAVVPQLPPGDYPAQIVSGLASNIVMVSVQ